jgi:hypothetical protein
MKKSKLRIIPLVLMGSALIGCNAITLAQDHDNVVTKTIVNQNHDGQYEVNGTCSWPDYGISNIMDGNNVWTIKKGVLNHKKYRFNITGKVEGDFLTISGERQSGKDFSWHSLHFSGKLTSPAGSELYGWWKGGD